MPQFMALLFWDPIEGFENIELSLMQLIIDWLLDIVHYFTLNYKWSPESFLPLFSYWLKLIYFFYQDLHAKENNYKTYFKFNFILNS